MDKDKNYIDDVEIFAPGYTCHEEKWREDNPGKPNFPAFKYPVVGPSGLLRCSTRTPGRDASPAANTSYLPHVPG